MIKNVNAENSISATIDNNTNIPGANEVSCGLSQDQAQRSTTIKKRKYF